MALLSHSVRILRCSVPIVLPNGSAHWHVEWKPAPFPASPAERSAAAKKYGLSPEDYVTYINDGNAPGDYPNLEPFNELHRDPFEHYDYGQVKRNYNEPIPWNWEFYSSMGFDPHQQDLRYNEPRWKTLLKFIAPLLIFGQLFYLGEQYKVYPAMMPKQYPFNGRDNYTFEPTK